MPGTEYSAVRKANGMVAGLFVCVGFGTLWIVMALGFWPARPDWTFPAAFVTALLLGFWTLLRRPAIRRMAESDTTPVRAYAGALYWSIVALEVIAINAAVIFLNATQRQALVPFAIAAIVGLHFLPLAWLFRVAAYYWAGATMLAWTGACLLIGDRANSAVALGFGMGAILWAAAILALARIKR